MAVAKKRKPAVKKLTREEELRQQLFVALSPAAVTLGWAVEKVINKANDMANDYLKAEGAIKDE